MAASFSLSAVLVGKPSDIALSARAKRALHMTWTASECQPFCTAQWSALRVSLPQVTSQIGWNTTGFLPAEATGQRTNQMQGRRLPAPTRSCARPAVLTASEARMANFPTHIAVGTVVSGALATVTVAADMVAPENIVAVTLAGVLGSVLPDIDLKEFAAAPGDVRRARGVLLLRRAVQPGAQVFHCRDAGPVARHAGVRALRRQADLLPLQLSPRHLAFAAGDGVLRLPHRLGSTARCSAATRAWPGLRPASCPSAISPT